MAIFRAWAAQAWRTRTTYLAEVAEKYKAKLGKLAESIWTMKKAELVDQVVERCGLTRSAAEAETVGQLRLMLKVARDGKREASGRAALQKGFARMRKEELQAECLSRGIVFENKNREQMIRDIKAYVQSAARMRRRQRPEPRILLHRRARRLDGRGQLGQWRKL